MSKVVVFPGPTRLDVPAERVLNAALGAGLESVVIAGYTADGEEYFASSIADGGSVLWLVEQFKRQLFEKADDLAAG